MNDIFEADAFSYAAAANNPAIIDLLVRRIDGYSLKKQGSSLLHKYIASPTVVRSLILVRNEPVNQTNSLR
jgi:hypothetical protein